MVGGEGMKCNNCLNARVVISENGTHLLCCLSEKVAMDCIMEKKDQRVPTMITLTDEEPSTHNDFLTKHFNIPMERED